MVAATLVIMALVVGLGIGVTVLAVRSKREEVRASRPHIVTPNSSPNGLKSAA